MALTVMMEMSGMDRRMKMFTLTERTCISRDGKKVIKEGKEDGMLLGPAGAQIPEEQAVALGLLQIEDAHAQRAERFDERVAKAGGKKAEDKAGKKPANKGGKKAEDKAGDE